MRSSSPGIPFASCYAYWPAAPCAASRRLRSSVKAGEVRALLDLALGRDAARPRAGPFVQFFPAGAILVPVPGSKARCHDRASPTARLARALMQRGLGVDIWFGLRRVRAVRKSGTAAPGSRPSVQTQFDTMAVDVEVPGTSSVVLIDDVVTKGRTLLAAALRLREALPEADIRAFALLRTLGYSPVVGEPLLPCIGTIEWKHEDARRNP
jgi:phosphoribosylpyrophosphate synthetase